MQYNFRFPYTLPIINITLVIAVTVLAYMHKALLPLLPIITLQTILIVAHLWLIKVNRHKKK